ncbi:restriction endonuclease subunit S [Vibrio harveyi]|uniref:restriction endonuclease subunit S n=1 Tax=Vibrio harveyi TaxID=669 RepID=UPI0018F17674|nr:restriction endonuclease subunit S [Vibrio harveyi]
MSKIKNCPQLRFSDFKESWETVRLGNYFTSVCLDSKESYPLYSLTISDGIVPKPTRYIREHLVKDELEAYKAMTHLDFAYNPMNVRFGAVAALKERATVNVSRYYDIFKANEHGDSYFFDEYLKSETMLRVYNKVATGTLVEKKRVHFSEFKELKVPLPSLLEQQKIASFLSKVDEKVALLTEKKDKLAEYKKGVMQQLFSGRWEEQGGQLTFIPPTLRFQADDGSEFSDWEEKKLGQVFTRIRRKNKENNQNVLTISAQKGLINQEKYFNKSVAAKDVTGYYLLENGDFAYNKSYSKGYPMGAIKRLNNYDKGVVSTLYICFGLNQGFVSGFFEHYFESGLQNRDLSKIAQEGARNHGLLNISVDEFFKDVKLLTPSYEEQLKIANFLSAIDQKIYLTNSELDKAKDWKKGLLQQMFV